MPRLIELPWDSQPQEVVSGGVAGLASHLTSLYAPSLHGDAVTGALATRAAGPIVTLPQDFGRFGGGISTQSSQIQIPVQPTSVKPWTLAIVCRFDGTISGALDKQIQIRRTAGPLRGIGLGFTSGSVLQGYVFDGSDKTVTHQTVIAYPPPVTVITGVVSCSDGFLRVFLNGVPGNTPVAVSNNGFASGDHFLSINEFANTGYGWPLVAYLDGVGWQEAQAREFDANPWQLFAPQQIYVPRAAAAGGVPTLSLPTAIDITASSFRPRVSYQY